MTPQEWQIELEALKCEREAMIADNQMYMFFDGKPVYYGEDFRALAEKFRVMKVPTPVGDK